MLCYTYIQHVVEIFVWTVFLIISPTAGTALVCLHNLRKTFKYGGRKMAPSIEEITAISAGRNSKRQIYRLPGQLFLTDMSSLKEAKLFTSFLEEVGLPPYSFFL